MSKSTRHACRKTGEPDFPFKLVWEATQALRPSQRGARLYAPFSPVSIGKFSKLNRIFVRLAPPKRRPTDPPGALLIAASSVERDIGVAFPGVKQVFGGNSDFSRHPGFPQLPTAWPGLRPEGAQARRRSDISRCSHFSDRIFRHLRHAGFASPSPSPRFADRSHATSHDRFRYRTSAAGR